MTALRDLTGLRFGSLTVLRRAPNKKQKTCWVCRCVCGKTLTFFGDALKRSESTISCGCQRGRHHLSKSPEYQAWRNMKTRCLATRGTAYAWYGSRGITVCDRWNDSFENFYADMGPRPGPGYSVERKDNSSSYSPTNCIWATMPEQNRNKRNNHMITINDQTACLMDWLHLYGTAAGTFDKRVKRGMSEADALS